MAEKDTLRAIQTLVKVKGDATLLSVEGRAGGYDLIFRLADTRARWHALIRDLLSSLASEALSAAIDISQQYRLKDGQLVVAGRIHLAVAAEHREAAFEELRSRLASLPTPGRARIMKTRLEDVSWMRPMANGSGVYKTSQFNPEAVVAAARAAQGTP